MRFTVVLAALALLAPVAAAAPSDPWSTAVVIEYMDACMRLGSMGQNDDIRRSTCGCVADTWRAMGKASMDDLVDIRTRCRKDPLAADTSARKLRTGAAAIVDLYKKCLSSRAESRDRPIVWDEAYCVCATDAQRGAKAESMESECKAIATRTAGTEKATWSVGVPSCDKYLDAMSRCTKSMAPEAYGPMMDSMRTMANAWRDAASTPEGRAALESGCSQAYEAARSAYKDMGCTF